MMPKNSERTPASPLPLYDNDYAALAAFRHSLRSFLAFSEEAARKAGLTPQQHQALLAVRGLVSEKGTTVGELASHLLLKPHTIVGLVDRLVQADLLLRKPDEEDRRRVLLSLTHKAKEVLKVLSAIHLAEIRRKAPQLADLLQRLSARV
jgi:DNA-binding MarR family transcriptional regulator